MSWFRKKRNFIVHYMTNGLINVEHHFIVKASDIAEATKIIQKKEVYPITVLDWEILDNERR